MDEVTRQGIVEAAMEKTARFGKASKAAAKSSAMKKALVRLGIPVGVAGGAGAAGGYEAGKEEYGLIRDAEGNPVGKRKLRDMIKRMYGGRSDK